MGFLSKLTQRLNQPFPNTESFLEDLKGLLVAGLIVTTILYVLKPFGMSNYRGSQLLVSVYFGLISIASGILFHFLSILVIKDKYKRENFKLKHWIGEILILLLFITAGNLLFSAFYFNDSLSLSNCLQMLLSTLCIGVFPVMLFGFKSQIKLERQNAAAALELAKTIDNSTESTSKEELILAVEAMQNYVHIYKVTGEEFDKITERKTLKTALEELSEHNLTKCHRSFLVNLNQVKEISGNAQGLKLKMNSEECPVIPVSRSFISEVKERLNSAIIRS